MSTMTVARDELTLLDALELRLCTVVRAPDGVAAPCAILWTDPASEWLPIVDALAIRLPELFVLGDFDPHRRTGPAIWLRCVVDRVLDDPPPPGDVPILYLPGVGRQVLRAGEDCPRGFQPLIELMYRGTLWLQRGGHDWTLSAFFASPDGLALDLSRDDETLHALPRALREVAETPIDQLRGRKLRADDFDRLLADDPIRDVLRWMSDPDSWRVQAGEDRWGAFRSQCRTRLKLNPERDGALTAGRLLGGGEGEWAKVWQRFEEAPSAYPGIPELLRRSKPADLFVDRSRWPDENDTAEQSLRTALAEIDKLPHAEACGRVIALEAEHGGRRGWLWARLGLAPMAGVLEPLAVLAAHARTALGGETPDEIATAYVDRAWRADAATWRAMALTRPADEAVVHEVVRALLEPWLEECARVFQRAVQAYAFPVQSNVDTVGAEEGGCLLFADGLRYDLGQALAERLEGRGCRVHPRHRWAALPTVTATGKPAVTPIGERIVGGTLPDDYAPGIDREGNVANALRIRAALEAEGYQLLDGSLNEWPVSEAGRGWCEEGRIDSLGHKLEVGLARQLEAEIDRLTERIVALLDAGWKSVRVVTDHGWLLLPGGLPKVDLPKHLTESRWSRCATIAGSARVDVPTEPWFWNPTQRFATAPGIACFNVSPVYAHGGVSIQECLIPDIIVERGAGRVARATIESVIWRRMRCIVQANTSAEGIRADLRLEHPLGTSVAAAVKRLDEDGRASLVLEDDRHEHATLVLVLLDEEDMILAQQTTRVGSTT